MVQRVWAGAGAVLALAMMAGASTTAAAQEVSLSGNFGFTSNYIFRGVEQTGEPNAFAGLDLEANGFYAGTWVTNVSPGLEVDFYGGYGYSFGIWSLGVQGTAYLYTDDDFDDPYYEGSLFVGLQPNEDFSLSAELTLGTYDTDPDTQDYTFFGLTADYKGFYGTLGTFGEDFEGSYGEAGYSMSLPGLDDTSIGVSIIYSDEDLAGMDDGDTYMVFSFTQGITIK